VIHYYTVTLKQVEHNRLDLLGQCPPPDVIQADDFTTEGGVLVLLRAMFPVKAYPAGRWLDVQRDDL
jgi:hypothetical protein